MPDLKRSIVQEQQQHIIGYVPRDVAKKWHQCAGEGSSESKSDALLQDMEAGLEDRSQPVEASPRAGEAPRSVPDEASPSPPLQGSRSIGNDTGSSSMEERKDLEQLKQWAPEEMLSNAMSLYSLTDMQTFWDPGSDTKAVLGWNRSLMVLAFRGTASLRNALSDIKVRLCGGAHGRAWRCFL